MTAKIRWMNTAMFHLQLNHHRHISIDVRMATIVSVAAVTASNAPLAAVASTTNPMSSLLVSNLVTHSALSVL